jgi:sigma-E factor negative regulatory protein RseC
MLETRAVVVQIMGEDAMVEAKQGGGCGHCSSANGCNGGKLSQLFCSSPRRFKVKNPTRAQVGDEVELRLADGVLLRSSVILYLLPLSLMLSSSILGAHLSPDLVSRDGYAVTGALLGLVFGFVLARILTARSRMSAVAQAVISSAV